MPQFDKFTFAPQLFWVFVIFVILYLYFLRVSLPTIATTLKLRNKKLSRATKPVSSDNLSTSGCGLSYLHELLLTDPKDDDIFKFDAIVLRIKKNVFVSSSEDSLRKSFTKYVNLL
jgi:hypothetical protein